MQMAFACPNCQTTQHVTLETAEQLQCAGCDWSRPVTATQAERAHPTACFVCGCHDLWRQKDFPQRVGVAMVALGAILSTIAYANYMPLLSLGILLGFAAIDLVLYAVMPDVLVCYRCSARYRNFDPQGPTGSFHLEVAERYRREQKIVAEARSSANKDSV